MAKILPEPFLLCFISLCVSGEGGKGCHWCQGVGWERRELLKVNSTVCIPISWSYEYRNQEAPRGRELLEIMLMVPQGGRLRSDP